MAEHETFRLLWHCACWDLLWISPTFTQLKLHFSILQPATVLLLHFSFGALQAAHADGTMSEWRKLELEKKPQELSACGNGVHTRTETFFDPLVWTRLSEKYSLHRSNEGDRCQDDNRPEERLRNSIPNNGGRWDKKKKLECSIKITERSDRGWGGDSFALICMCLHARACC